MSKDTNLDQFTASPGAQATTHSQLETNANTNEKTPTTTAEATAKLEKSKADLSEQCQGKLQELACEVDQNKVQEKTSQNEKLESAELIELAKLRDKLDALRLPKPDHFPTPKQEEYRNTYEQLRVGVLIEVRTSADPAATAQKIAAQLDQMTDPQSGKIELKNLKIAGFISLNKQLHGAESPEEAKKLLREGLQTRQNQLVKLAEATQVRAENGNQIPAFEDLPKDSLYRLGVVNLAEEVRQTFLEAVGGSKMSPVDFDAVWTDWQKILPPDLAGSLPPTLESVETLQESVGVKESQFDKTAEFLEKHGLPADNAAVRRELAAQGLFNVEKAFAKAERVLDSDPNGIKMSDGDIALYLFTTILQFGIPINLISGEWGGALLLAGIGAGATEMVHPGSLGKISEAIGLKQNAPEKRLLEFSAKFDDTTKAWLHELALDDLIHSPLLRSYLQDPHNHALTSDKLVSLLQATETNEKWTKRATRLPDGQPKEADGRELPEPIDDTAEDAQKAQDLFDGLKYALENRIDPKTIKTDV